MKLLLDVNEKNAPFVIELLRNLPFVKTRQLTNAEAKVLENLAEAISEVKLAKQGKVRLKRLDKLLNEL